MAGDDLPALSTPGEDLARLAAVRRGLARAEEGARASGLARVDPRLLGPWEVWQVAECRVPTFAVSAPAEDGTCRLVPYAEAARFVEEGAGRYDQPPMWGPPWLGQLLHLRRAGLLTMACATWSMLRAVRDPEWGEALASVQALAPERAPDPVVAFLHEQMAEDGYCTDCGVRRTRAWLAEATGWEPCTSKRCSRSDPWRVA